MARNFYKVSVLTNISLYIFVDALWFEFSWDLLQDELLFRPIMLLH